MILPVLMVGAGGHAKVLVDALLASSALIAGIVDIDERLHGTCILGVPVLGGDEVVREFPASEVLLVNGVGSITLPVARRRIFEKFKELGYHFAPVVHPSAVVAPDVTLGEGAQIMAGAVVQAGSSIGANCVVNTRASVDHDCTLGQHVHVSPGVTLSGGVVVGDATHIGTGVTVIQGVTIGSSCLVAAGAVVTKNINDGAMVRGVPAREFV